MGGVCRPGNQGVKKGEKRCGKGGWEKGWSIESFGGKHVFQHSGVGAGNR